MKRIIRKSLVIALMIITACAFTLEAPETVCAASKCSKPKITNYTNSLCDEITVSFSGGGKKANIFFVYMKTAGGSYKKIAAVKTSKGAKKSTVIQGLNPSTNYVFKVRAANAYKKKQYYNSKKKKWQNKRPKKKNWKGKKTRKVAAYRWYSSYSSAKTIRTADLAAGGQPGNEANTSPFPAIPGTTLTYGSTTFYLGQEWTSSMCTALKNASNGYESVTRPRFAMSTKDGKIYDATMHLFDINDYSDFLAVYVCGGQVISWTTNSSSFGTVNGKNITWGDNVENYTYGLNVGYRTNGSACTNCFTNIDRGDTVLGGFDVVGISEEFPNIESEKRVGYHCINAYRVKAGVSKLAYANKLDGKNYTWTGTVDGQQYNNVRYGAQPFVETAYASRKVGHNAVEMTQGPLAGMTTETRDLITYYASGLRPIGEIIATGRSGEACLGSYMSSNLHMQILLYSDYTSMGIGLTAGYNGVIFGK